MIWLPVFLLSCRAVKLASRAPNERTPAERLGCAAMCLVYVAAVLAVLL